ncbi:uncharacterized protein LOC103572815 [Microplitis demolitor]|uniref:uncharacterized protein LOC103572815 n=1 Tax=Microplitis demolitor TaxID=69319 RepID=UPI0004CCFB2C|nr:uncharacterized protein LOC103572815 [Microplitis demolitor]
MFPVTHTAAIDSSSSSQETMALQRQVSELSRQVAAFTTAFNKNRGRSPARKPNQRSRSNSKPRKLDKTGIYLSVYPYGWMKCKPTPEGYQLHAANGSLIETYGCITLSLNLGLRREFTWRFIIADITKPIIAADFLSHFNLLIDHKHRQLCDGFTGLQTRVDSIRSDAKCIELIEGDTVYHKLLSNYPAITRPEGITSAKKHSTVHHIKTTSGPPVSCKARHLAPNKLKIAQEEFCKMVQLGIAHPLTSLWASPLYLVPKKSGD